MINKRKYDVFRTRRYINNVSDKEFEVGDLISRGFSGGTRSSGIVIEKTDSFKTDRNSIIRRYKVLDFESQEVENWFVTTYLK